ncbi:peptidoglycan DD-metalloendopeptidase family protein [Chloroflexota bacterium]
MICGTIGEKEEQLSGANDKRLDKAYVSKLFQERLMFYNSLDEMGFEEWVFHPAMLFGADYKWWGDLGKRDRPHEGLDLCLYRTKEEDIRYLDEKTKVPVIFKGKIVKVVDDFLGASVFVSHSDYESDGSQLLTIYGHIRPRDHMRPGERLSEGDIIGTIANAKGSSGAILSHLHISVAWIPNTMHSQELSWQIVGDITKVMLLDPLSVIECPHSIALGV